MDGEELKIKKEAKNVVSFNQCLDTNTKPTKEILINEVAWASKAGNTSEEWIELYNSGVKKSLEGWQLLDGDRSMSREFSNNKI